MKKLLIFCIPLLLIIAPSTNAQETSPQWRDRVFYEIFVRSFYDSDGDGVGDLQGVIEKLDYLNDGDPSTTSDLGVTGIWLMPIMPSPSYHGYDVTDYRDINPDYGTMDDFRQLLDAAHQRGIVVVIDLVLNHTSTQHPWFIASREGEEQYADWYVWREDDPGTRGPWNQEVWHSYGGRNYYALFWDQMPDLNYNNPDVTAEMYDVARFWLQDVGVDGFRLDAVMYFVEEGETLMNSEATIAWINDFKAYVDEIAPDALLVGEVWTDSSVVAQYVPGGLDVAFEFTLAESMLAAANGSALAMEGTMRRILDLYPDGQYAVFLTNHDQDRVMSELLGNVDKARIAASLLLTSPGVPFLYYGEEIGLVGQKPDERIRTPMQWDNTAESAGFTTASQPWQPLAEGFGMQEDSYVSVQTDNPGSLLSHYRNLIHLRNNTPALQYGTYIPADTSERGLYAFVRQTEEQTVLVLINLTRRAISGYTVMLDQGIGLSGTTASMLFGGAADVSTDVPAPVWGNGGTFADYTPLAEIPGAAVVVIELQ